jgi:hypothetical protein
MNIQKQNTIDEHRQIIDKDCLIHDQSFKWYSGTSVNNQTQAIPCMFGACIRQIVNWGVTTCRKFPNVKILASKFGFNQFSGDVISTQPRQSKLARNLSKSAFSS